MDMLAGARTEIEWGWIERARKLRPLLDASAPTIDTTCSLPEDLLDALHAAKMFRMFLPHTFGGAELEPATLFQVVCEIAAGDTSTAWTVAQSSGCSMSAAYMAPEAAQKVFGDVRRIGISNHLFPDPVSASRKEVQRGQSVRCLAKTPRAQ